MIRGMGQVWEPYGAMVAYGEAMGGYHARTVRVPYKP